MRPRSRRPRSLVVLAVVLVTGVSVGGLVDDVDDDDPLSSLQARDPGPGGTGEDGDRSSPAALGETVSLGEWEVVVNEFTRDATDLVMATNQFNEPPPPGSEHALVNVTVTNTGDEVGEAMFVGVAYVTAAGNVINWYDSVTVVPDSHAGELYPGASATGNLGITIPVGDDGLLRVGTPGQGPVAFVDGG